MIISIWRYSHLTLALSSFIFIIIAAITGIILAFEPVVEQLKPYEYPLEKYHLTHTISALESRYDDVYEIERDHNDYIIASVLTREGNDERFYIDPATGKKVGNLIKKAPIFKYATNLHRSLFLKSTGRIIVGIVSLLLFLIALTGTVLICKRQGGISKFFTKIIKEDTQQYYHVLLGRYCLIPIVIITITGVYLSAVRFITPPKKEANHLIGAQKEAKDSELFQKIVLKDLKKVEFPFTDDSEDYFHINLKTRELIVHQYTGMVLSEVKHPFSVLASSLGLTLHTGRGSILWSFVLLLATSSVLYFVYSGFVMTFKRRKKNVLIPKNTFHKDAAEYVILVGSETGSTYKTAELIFNAIRNVGEKVFITEMNQFSRFKKMKHLLILTATYGAGEPPSNARQFLEKFKKLAPNNKIKYSVVGFGSLAYPDFCQFAIDVNTSLSKYKNFKPTTPLFKIHNQSFSDVQRWAKDWGQCVELDLQLKEEVQQVKLPRQEKFRVIRRTELNKDNTFLLQLKSNKKITFQSGDILVFYPKENPVARYYSIGVFEKDILLGIKKHVSGVSSSYFSQLNFGDTIEAHIQKNSSFYPPKDAQEIICISNGTGIVPFLGMIQENIKHAKIHLFWGGRTKNSFKLYEDIILKALDSDKLSSFYAAYSREKKQKVYIQDLIDKQYKMVARVLSKKGIIMICGSLAMEKDILNKLKIIAEKQLKRDFKNISSQIKTDCY